MSARSLRPANVGAAIVAISGGVMVVYPQHATSILQIVIVALAASMALYALAANVPPTGWLSPFKWGSPFDPQSHTGPRKHTLNELSLVRHHLTGRRQVLEHGPPLPPSTLRLLRPLLETHLDLDARDPKAEELIRSELSSLTLEILDTDPLHRPSWIRTRLPNEHVVGTAIHHVLDDLERLRPGSTRAEPHDEPA